VSLCDEKFVWQKNRYFCPPISRLLDQTVTTRSLPLYKTDGQYTYLYKVILVTYIFTKKYMVKGASMPWPYGYKTSAHPFCQRILLVVWWWKPKHLLMRDNMGKNKWYSHKIFHCLTQTLYGFTQIWVTTSHTNFLCGFLCDFRE
jgi:hypothetical protein